MNSSLPAASAGPARTARWVTRNSRALDLDRDGFLGVAELLKEPMAPFACTAADAVGSLSQSQVQSRIERCDPSMVCLKFLKPTPNDRTRRD